jgi:RNA polymerase II subunit A-like phosphatase
VDAARKRGGVKIVWLAWFTDCIALWKHLDESPYLLDDPPVTVGSGSSPTVDSHQISSDPDPDTDDWDEPDSGAVTNNPKGLELRDINWDDINDEVEAAMNESDDDDDTRSNRTGMRSENVSEDENSFVEESSSVVRFVTAKVLFDEFRSQLTLQY